MFGICSFNEVLSTYKFNKCISILLLTYNIYTFQRDTQCGSTDCLLMFRCQLYMFRTVTVHSQELLFRCCMCRLWYVVRNALSDTSRWYNVVSQSSTLLNMSFYHLPLQILLIVQRYLAGFWTNYTHRPP